MGCSKEVKIPDDVIPPEKMTAILIDIHLLEEKINYLRLDQDTSLMLYKAYEFDLLKKHNVDTTLYQRSYKFYASEVRHMTKIYEAVVDSLNVRHKMASTKNKDDEKDEPDKKSPKRITSSSNESDEEEDE